MMAALRQDRSTTRDPPERRSASLRSDNRRDFALSRDFRHLLDEYQLDSLDKGYLTVQPPEVVPHVGRALYAAGAGTSPARLEVVADLGPDLLCQFVHLLDVFKIFLSEIFVYRYLHAEITLHALLNLGRESFQKLHHGLVNCRVLSPERYLQPVGRVHLGDKRSVQIPLLGACPGHILYQAAEIIGLAAEYDRRRRCGRSGRRS